MEKIQLSGTRHEGTKEKMHSSTKSQPQRYIVVEVMIRPHWPRERTPTLTEAEAWWAPDPVQTCLKMRKSPSGNGTPVRPTHSRDAVPTEVLRGIYQIIPRLLFQSQYMQIHFHPVHRMNVNKKPNKRGRTQSNVLAKHTTECREKKWIVSEKKDLTIKLFYITTHNTITYTCQFLYLLVGMAPIFACFFKQPSVFKCRNNEQVLQISITILKT